MNEGFDLLRVVRSCGLSLPPSSISSDMLEVSPAALSISSTIALVKLLLLSARFVFLGVTSFLLEADLMTYFLLPVWSFRFSECLV